MKFVNINTRETCTHIYSEKGFTVIDARTKREWRWETVIAITADDFSKPIYDDRDGNILLTYKNYHSASCGWIGGFIDETTQYRYIIVRD